jgi:WD40 repeat protein
VVSGSYGGRVALWTIDGDPVNSFKANPKNLTSALLSTDMKMLATAGLGDDIQIWQIPEFSHLDSLSGHKTAVTVNKYIQNGAVLVSSGYEGTIKFWDAENWKLIKSLDPELSNMRAVAFSSDEEILAVTGESQVKLFDTHDFSLLNILPVTTRVINGIAFSPDGKWVALGAADKNIRIWTR